MRADGPPSPDRGACRGSWLSTWAGDITGPADQETVLKIPRVHAILIVGLTSVIPSWPDNFSLFERRSVLADAAYDLGFAEPLSGHAIRQAVEDLRNSALRLSGERVVARQREERVARP